MDTNSDGMRAKIAIEAAFDLNIASRENLANDMHVLAQNRGGGFSL
jgi:hypothetical protein